MKQLVMGSHRSEHWKPEEDVRLIELIEAGKSWVLISALLKRSVKTLQDQVLRRRADSTTGGSGWMQCSTLGPLSARHAIPSGLRMHAQPR